MINNLIDKKHKFLRLILAAVLIAGTLAPSAAFAEQPVGASSASQTGSSAWRKTLDRHALLSTAYGNGVYAAVGNDGVIKVSSDSVNWTVVNNGRGVLNKIIWADGKFVAVGSMGRILTSSDGSNWKDSVSGTGKELKDVAWNGAVFIAAGDRGTLLLSRDGISWANETMDVPYSFSGITGGGDRFILTTSDTFNYIFTSVDGTDWKKVTPDGGLYGFYNTAFSNGTFVMYGKIPNQGGYAELTSKDGENWTEVPNAPDARGIAAYDNGFAAVGASFRDSGDILTQNVYFSEDGKTWRNNEVKWGSSYYTELKAITDCKDEFIGLNYRGEIYRSADGLQWTCEQSGLEYQFEKITWDGGQLVAYDGNGNMETSQDGTTWTKSTVKLALGQPVQSLFYLNHDVIIAIAGDPARMYVSKDGANWKAHDFNGLQYARIMDAGDQYLLDTGNEMYRSADAVNWEKINVDPIGLKTAGIAFDGKTYVSAGGQATIYGGEGNHSDPLRVIATSSNLKDWKISRSDNTSALSSIVWAKNRFVAVGEGGTIMTSKDGLSDWTQSVSNTTNDLYHIVWDGSRFIAAGDKGTILSSVDGVNWTAENGITSDPITRIIVHGNKYFALAPSTVLSGTFAPAPKADRFDDIGTHWAKASINEMADRKLINGVDGKNFKPDRPITRAEFAAIITRALDLKPSTEAIFSDVKKTDWYYESVSAAYKNGILNGYGHGLIKPSSEITREEAMTMTARALQLKGVDTEVPEAEMTAAIAKFSDRDKLSTWAKSSAAVCIQRSVIEGSNGFIKPSDPITRAETAAIVLRMLNQSN